jgi:cytochrome c
MNSFELNKVLGAILGTCLILLAIHLGAQAIFATEKPEKPGYKIVVAKAETGKPEAKKEETPLPVLLAHASVDKGKQIARQCEACHTLEKGQPNKVGPNLYGIVGDERGKDRGGFNFSSAMKSKGGKWTFEEIFKFIDDPRGYIPGTAMTFAGIKNPQQRADVIAYLRTLSDNPVPLPKVEAAAKPAAAPAAEPKKAAAPAEKTLPQMFADASVEKGKQTAKQCEACHTLTKGGPNRVGPNLYNIVGSPRGEDRGGFNFSAAMKKKGGKWTYEELYKFLKDPRGYIPGTLMTFAGVQNDQRRVDVIAYLRTLSDNPLPPPK